MQKALLLLTLTICLFACKKESDKATYEKKAALAYGTDPKQVMDLYLPSDANASTTKLMILIHGGAWADGDKTDFDIYITELQRRLPDYAFANINYRLYASTGQNKFPAQEEDVKAAVSFLMNKSGDLKFSKTFVLLGASAGGQLALLQGYKYAGIAKPKAIISFFGPTDFTHLYNNPGLPIVPSLLTTIIGATPAQNAALYESYSPIHFVTAQSAHTLLLQGGKDELVPVAQATRLIAKLNEAGVVNEYIYYPNEGHSWTGPNLDDSFNKVETFIRQHVP
jgi:acetyl esterase/lipase